MKHYSVYALVFISSLLTSCHHQNQPVSPKQKSSNSSATAIGGPFENADYIYIGMPEKITATDTSAGWQQDGDQLLLTGTVYQPDGHTPAADVLIYYYHTNIAGKYLHKAEERRSMPANNRGQTHGYIRGWVKTNAQGKYFIYTVRPGTYPSRDEPAHVHVTIKEPALNEYYIDEFVFDDDPLLTSAKRQQLDNRGGSGILRLVKKDELYIGERNIILGLNIPDYPKSPGNDEPGNAIGEDVVSFTPFHAWGADKGSRTCPVCKYGWYHGILYCVGKDAGWENIKSWLRFLEDESVRREKYLKVYFVYGDPSNYSEANSKKLLENLGHDLQLKKVALTFVPSFTDKDSKIYLNNINPTVDNSFIIYKRSRIIGKYINLQPTKDNFALIKNCLDESINEYFYLSAINIKPETLNVKH